MKVIRWFDENIEKVFLVFFSVIMVSVIFLQVMMRQLDQSLSWSEELARYCFIWMIYIGISLGVKEQKHVRIDAFLLLLNQKGQMILNFIVNLFFMAFAIFVIIYGTKLRINYYNLAKDQQPFKYQWVMFIWQLPLEWAYTDSLNSKSSQINPVFSR